MTGPNELELRKRLESIENLHIDWGPEAYKLTREERCGAILESLKEGDKWHALPRDEQMLIQMEDIEEYIRNAINLMPMFSIDEYINGSPEDKEKQINLTKVDTNLDMALLLLGNWTRKDPRKVV